jgi:hypothetical protein
MCTKYKRQKTPVFSIVMKAFYVLFSLCMNVCLCEYNCAEFKDPTCHLKAPVDEDSDFYLHKLKCDSIFTNLLRIKHENNFMALFHLSPLKIKRPIPADGGPSRSASPFWDTSSIYQRGILLRDSPGCQSQCHGDDRGRFARQPGSRALPVDFDFQVESSHNS